jgi:putative addiction module component (TIGR02574 family)
MSKADILAELPKLTREERRELVMKVQELDGDEWLDEGLLSAEEKAMLAARFAEHERNPGAAIPWSRFEARLDQRLNP